jgi:hypothetical protein
LKLEPPDETERTIRVAFESQSVVFAVNAPLRSLL